MTDQSVMEKGGKEQILIATGNKDKMREIRMILAQTAYEPVSMKEAGLVLDIKEDGSSFEENALIKARAVSRASCRMAVADDSGLEVDALNKEPGICSARYMGEDTSYHIKNQNIIDRLAGVPDEKRTARFVCAMACVFPDGREYVWRETMEGRIGYREEGENGFGYDPIFYLPEYGCTSAQLPPEEKNRISHRGKALERLKAFLSAQTEAQA